MEADSMEEADASSPLRCGSARCPSGGGVNGLSSLGSNDNSNSNNSNDGSLGLEYDLWEGQFQFIGGEAALANRPVTGHYRPELHAPMYRQVQMIQEQMHVLVDTQSAGEERYARVKQENATLQARILMLEEAARDAESRAEDKLETEQRRHRDWANRLEREKELQLENLTIKLQAAEIESSRSRDEVAKLHDQLGKFRAEMSRLEGILEETRLEVQRTREAERRAALGLVEINRKLQRAEEELAHRINAEHRIEEMVQEMENLRTRNKNLEESRDELQAAAAALQAGRELLMPAGQDPNDNKISRTNSPSLATELLLTGSTKDQADGINTGICRAGDICDNNITTLAEALQALKDQREVNTRLRSYIDGILLNIVENYPQLLEVKQPH